MLWEEGWKLLWLLTSEVTRKNAGKVGLPEINLGVLVGTRILHD